MVLLEECRTFDIASTVFADDARDVIHERSSGRREGDARCRWTCFGIFEDVEEVGSYGAVAASISIARNADGRGLGAKQCHERIVKRPYGLRIAHAKVDVAKERERVLLEVPLARFA